MYVVTRMYILTSGALSEVAVLTNESGSRDKSANLSTLANF